MSENIGLSSPWVIFARKITALFEKDPDIKCVWDNDECNLKIYVESSSKAEALTQILPTEKVFGNIVMTITVIPANRLTNNINLFKDAFANNPSISFIETIHGLNNPLTFIVFEPEVVQYYNDSAGDYHGVASTLYQDLAEDIFENREGIYFCTDLVGD